MLHRTSRHHRRNGRRFVSRPLRAMAVFAASLLSLLSLPLFAAEVDSASDTAVKMAFVYNFGKFVEWPPAAFNDSGHRVVLCTIGDVSAFSQGLSEINGKKVQNRELQVVHIARLNDLGGCDTLFIAQSERDRLGDVLAAVSKRPTLTISDIEGFTDKGGMIGLLVRNERVQFDVNLTAARSAGLQISSELLKLAHAVVGAEPN
jgi:hypothetical protein